MKLPEHKQLHHSQPDYSKYSLDEKHLDPDPMKQFAHWFQYALREKISDVNAMTLATANEKGNPSARIVLLKEYNPLGFIFYTNYQSSKGNDLSKNPRAALVLYWKELERQVRVTGTVKKISRSESEKYFHSRPIGSQLSAWASRQSTAVESRDVLEKRLKYFQHKFNWNTIPLPPNWGGYLLTPRSIEFWQGRENRLHDRILYRRSNSKKWKMDRLSP